MTLPFADGLIAATALEHGLTLVTCNTKDFFGLGLMIVNPWDPQPKLAVGPARVVRRQSPG